MDLKNEMQMFLSMTIIIILLAGCSQPAAVIPITPQAAATDEATEAAIESPQPNWKVTDAGPLIFYPGSTFIQTPGDLQPYSAIRFTVSALKGQQVSMWLTTEPALIDLPLATLTIMDGSGTVLTSEPLVYWSQVMAADQTLTVEIKSLASEDILYSYKIEIPAEVIDPVAGEVYEPIETSLCFMLQEEMATALDKDIYTESQAPFLDVVGREAGQGCRLTATGTGVDFSDPWSVVNTLISTVGAGWTQSPDYAAGGGTGSVAGLYRDMALMLIKVNWKPDMGVECPADQPLDDCGLTPEQMIYTIEIDVAQNTAGFSMDGHWVDAATGFTLDLYQDWKQIYGQHAVVAQDGNKIDSLEASINGWLKGQVATVKFQSSFTDQPGTAEITYLDINTIQWKIIEAPAGEFYLPIEATLIRTAQ
ncbi:MAG: hypothetical protein CVU42_08495 [Chloroflexi bacterium HGW-Chloroflexi-4]|jgi:hypothetical protein|nr:MAG: hypothetical protein CVU42_08495 [Chloroflexi bacterium HGW-Chloroflexi-4]